MHYAAQRFAISLFVVAAPVLIYSSCNGARSIDEGQSRSKWSRIRTVALSDSNTSGVGGQIAVILPDGRVEMNKFSMDPRNNLVLGKAPTLIEGLSGATSLGRAAHFAVTPKGLMFWGASFESSRDDVAGPMLAALSSLMDDKAKVVDVANKSGGWSVLHDNGHVERIAPGVPKRKQNGAALDNVVAIDGGALYTTMLRSDGAVWESNPKVSGVIATADAHRIEGLADIQEISTFEVTGTSNSDGVALAKDGRVYYWGVPMTLQDAFPSGNDARNDNVHRLENIEKPKAIAAGPNCAGVVDPQGNVWVWGFERPTGLRRSSANNVPEMVPGLKDIVAIDFGFNLAVALSSDGTVWAWDRSSPPHKIFEKVKVP